MAPLTPADNPNQDTFEKTFAATQEGDTVFEGTRDGFKIILKKIDGKPTVEAVRETDSVSTSSPDSFCHVAALAAVFALGIPVLTSMVASGGGVIVGVVIGAEAAQAILDALIAGEGVSAIVSKFIC